MVVIYKFIKLVKFRVQVYSQDQKNQKNQLKLLLKERFKNFLITL